MQLNFIDAFLFLEYHLKMNWVEKDTVPEIGSSVEIKTTNGERMSGTVAEKIVDETKEIIIEMSLADGRPYLRMPYKAITYWRYI